MKKFPLTPLKKIQNSSLAWIIVISSAVFFFIDFVQMTMQNPFKAKLIEIFQLAAHQDELGFSMISSAFSIGNWLFILPAGMILNRLSVRKVMLSMLLLSCFGALGAAWSTNFKLFLLCRFLSGVAHAFCFLCCTTLVTRWFSSDRSASVMGVVIAIGLAGSFFAQAPLLYLNDLLGFSWALTINVFIGLTAFVVALVFLQNYPDGHQETEMNRSTIHSLTKFRNAFLNKNTLLYGSLIAFLNAPILTMGANYLSSLLQDTYQHSNEIATHIGGFLFLGNIAGAFIAGWIAQFMRSYKKPLLVASVLLAAATLAIILGKNFSILELKILCFFIGFLSGGQVIAYPAIVNANKPSDAPFALSINSFIVMGSIPLFQALSGYLFQMLKNNNLSSLLEYTFNKYVFGLLPVILGLFCAILIAIFIKEHFGYQAKVDTDV